MLLKGQCHNILDTFYKKKTPPGPHTNRQKRFCESFRFRKDIREKRVSASPTASLTRCQRSQGLCGHCVSVVNDNDKDYADTWEIILFSRKLKN